MNDLTIALAACATEQCPCSCHTAAPVLRDFAQPDDLELVEYGLGHCWVRREKVA